MGPRAGWTGLSTLVLLGAMLAVPAAVGAQQVVGLSVGRFATASESRRSDTDVLRANRDFLTFDLGNFDNVIVGGDWMLAVNDYVEAGAGLEFYQRTVPTVYTNLSTQAGAPLALDVTVRTVSVPVTARLFPLTRNGPVQPYVGGGVAIHLWRYIEEGVVSVTALAATQGSLIDQGIALGPVVLGGIRIPVGPADIGGEVRFRSTEAQLKGGRAFAGTTLDLGGLSTVATVQFRFP